MTEAMLRTSTHDAAFLFPKHPYTTVHNPKEKEVSPYKAKVNRLGSFLYARIQETPSMPNKIGHTTPNTQEGGRKSTVFPAFFPTVQSALVE
jgi:hypothetical protein